MRCGDVDVHPGGTYILDPIMGRLMPPWRADHSHDSGEECGIYLHDVRMCAHLHKLGPINGGRLFSAIFFFPTKACEALPVAIRRKLAGYIDDLHRAGARWPRFPDGPWGIKDWPLGCRVRGVTCQRTDPPQRGYCVRWTGAFWQPCARVKERREAGYVGLSMRWPGDKPKPGEYLTTGERARFAYRVAEIERFDQPRGARRYTCRIWCERVDPLLVPKKATVHVMRWDARPRRKAA